jgi:type IV secretory pathway VirB2 component (pilin)
MSADSIISFVRRTGSVVLALFLCLPAVAFAQSPWERAASNLERTFTGPLARSLALVAIVIGGLMFMFERLAQARIAGIVRRGLALFARSSSCGCSDAFVLFAEVRACPIARYRPV